VIIPTQDHDRVLGECIRSIFRQSRQADEILVVDRRSRDATLTILQEDYPSVKIVKLKRNVNLSRALNTGIRFSSHPFVAVVFPSAKLDGKYFESVVENLEKPENADVGSATGKIFKMFRGTDIIDSSGLEAGEGVFPPAKRGEGQKGEGNFETVEPVLGVARAAAIYRRSLLEDVSLFGETFDESLEAALEDVDLAWRAHLQGWRGLYVPKARAVFDVHDDGPGPTFPNATSWEHDWRVVVMKNAPTHELIRGLHRAVLAGAGSATREPIGLISTIFALAEVTVGWTELRCKRQEIQRRAAERATENRRKRA
jgi:GT2 family glycosyltransferase